MIIVYIYGNEAQEGFVTHPGLPRCCILDWDRDPGRLASQSVLFTPKQRVTNSPILEKHNTLAVVRKPLVLISMPKECSCPQKWVSSNKAVYSHG